MAVPEAEAAARMVVLDRVSAIVHEPVVVRAEQDEVLEARLASPSPVLAVVSVEVAAVLAARPAARAVVTGLDAFRDVFARYVSVYAFVLQIVSYVDRELERDYLYGRSLLSYLPGPAAEKLDLGRRWSTHLKIRRPSRGWGRSRREAARSWRSSPGAARSTSWSRSTARASSR